VVLDSPRADCRENPHQNNERARRDASNADNARRPAKDPKARVASVAAIGRMKRFGLRFAVGEPRATDIETAASGALLHCIS